MFSMGNGRYIFIVHPCFHRRRNMFIDHPCVHRRCFGLLKRIHEHGELSNCGLLRTCPLWGDPTVQRSEPQRSEPQNGDSILCCSAGKTWIPPCLLICPPLLADTGHIRCIVRSYHDLAAL